MRAYIDIKSHSLRQLLHFPLRVIPHAIFPGLPLFLWIVRRINPQTRICLFGIRREPGLWVKNCCQNTSFTLPGGAGGPWLPVLAASGKEVSFPLAAVGASLWFFAVFLLVSSSLLPPQGLNSELYCSCLLICIDEDESVRFRWPKKSQTPSSTTVAENKCEFLLLQREVPASASSRVCITKTKERHSDLPLPYLLCPAPRRHHLRVRQSSGCMQWANYYCAPEQKLSFNLT